MHPFPGDFQKIYFTAEQTGKTEEPGSRKEGRGTSKVTMERTPKPRPGNRRAWAGSEQNQESQSKTAEKQPEE